MDIQDQEVRVSAMQLSNFRFNPLINTLKPQSNGPLYSNTVTGTQAVDGWAATLVQRRRGLGGLGPPRPLLAVPNVRAHPSLAVPTSYYSIFF